MDSTVVVDCGRHSTKYAVISRRHHRTDNGTIPVKQLPSPMSSFNSTVTAAEWNCVLPQIVSSEVTDGGGVSLLLLLDTLLHKRQREALLSSTFEHIGAKRVCLSYSAATALFAGGETSGVAVDLGYTSVRATPVEDGVPVTSMAISMDAVGARYVDSSLRHMLGDQQLPDVLLSTVKAQCCWVGSEEPPLPEEFSLPDGSTVQVNLTPQDYHQAANCLLYSGTTRVPDILHHFYQKFTVSCGTPVPHWVLFGGAAGMHGVNSVLAGSISSFMLDSPPRQLMVQNSCNGPVDGGVILSHLSSFKGMCVSMEEYEEDGPERCVHVKVADRR